MPRTATIAATALATIAAGAAAPAGAPAANGPLAYVTDGKVLLQPAAGGPPVLRAGTLSASSVSASHDGSLLAVVRDPIDRRDSSRVALMPAGGGKGRALVFRGLTISALAVSPDRRLLAFTAFRFGDDTPGHVFAYVARIDGTGLRPLRTATRFAYDIEFTPDGRSLVYIGDSMRGENAGCATIRRIRLDQTRDRLLYRGAGGARPCPFQLSLSPGGTSLAMTAATSLDEPAGPGPPSGVWRLGLRPGSRPVLLSPTALHPAWSPDGRQIAFGAFGRDDDAQYPGRGPHGLHRIDTAGRVPVKIAEQQVDSLAWLAAP